MSMVDRELSAMTGRCMFRLLLVSDGWWMCAAMTDILE